MSLKMQLFGTVKLLIAILGSSCPLSGPIWSQHVSKMGPNTGQKSYQQVARKMIPKISQKNAHFGPQKWAPKLDQNGAQKCFFVEPLFDCFFEALELFGCLLGAFLGLLRLSWGVFGPQKRWKTAGFIRFSQLRFFGSLKVLLAILGSSFS